MLSGVKLRENGYQLTLSSSGSYVEKRGTRMNLTRDGKRDIANLIIYKKIKEANFVTMKGLQREVAKVKKDMKSMRMGPVPGMNDEMKKFTEEEQRQHIRSNHAVYDTRCELCVQTRRLARHP